PFVVFFILTFVISWSYETSSILTGFPFGHYVYADKLGPKLWLVPLLIMPAYFSMGYIAWTIGHILLDRFDNQLVGAEVVLVPVLASFVMVMWDLCIDPASSTVTRAWIWRGGGGYFGVPWQARRPKKGRPTPRRPKMEFFLTVAFLINDVERRFHYQYDFLAHKAYVPISAGALP